ncbi:MAG: O-antigen ligase family protein [Phycisphaerae bacterium]|jgi:O-antigen ligase
MQRGDQNPLLERLQQVMESEYSGLLIMVLSLAVAIGVALIVMRAYRPLLMLLLVGQTFSLMGGPTQGVLTLLRYGAVFALFPLGLYGMRRVGLGPALMLCYGLYMFLWVPFAENVSWSLQICIGFVLLSVGLTGATLRYVTDTARLQRAIGVVALVGVVWIAVNLVFGSAAGGQAATGGGKFAGVTDPQSLGVVSAGVASFVLWGLMKPGNRKLYKYTCGAGAIIMLPMLIRTAQRGGLFGAMIGMIPLLLFRLGLKRLLGAAVLIGLVVAATAIVLSMVDPVTHAIIVKRLWYQESGTTGRMTRWMVALGAIMRNPIIGHGAGMSEYFSHRYFTGGLHNSYLSLWYDGGAVALGLWLAAMSRAAWQCVRVLASKHADPVLKDAMRGVFGGFLALAATGLVESKLASPTNFNASMMLFCIVLIERAAALARQPAARRVFIVRRIVTQPVGGGGPPALGGPAPGGGGGPIQPQVGGS